MKLKIFNIDLIHGHEYEIDDLKEIVATDFYEADGVAKAALIGRMR